MRLSSVAGPVLGAMVLLAAGGAGEAAARGKRSRSADAKAEAKPVPAVQASSAAPETPFHCPPSQVVEVDADAWKAQLLAAKGWAAHNRLLAKLRMRPVWVDRQSDAFPTCDEVAQLTDVAVHAVDLTHAEYADRVVEARYALCVKNDPVALRVQVLRPLGGPGRNAYCALGDEVSVDRDASTLPCELGSAQPRSLDFLNVVDAERQVLVVRDVSGRCDEHPQRREELWYLVPEGAGLKRLFELPTLETSRSSDGEERVVHREVAPTGGFPKTLQVTESAHVGARDEPARQRTFVLRDGAYRE